MPARYWHKFRFPDMARTTLRQRIHHGFVRWALRRQGQAQPTLTLTHRQIYILPTRAGIGFAVLLLLIWIGSLNYALNLGYLLAFWLAGVGLQSMLDCFRNQSGLAIHCSQAEAVFVGQTARFPIHIHNPGKLARTGIELAWPDHPANISDLPACTVTTLLLDYPATRRGQLRPGRLTLANRQPLGLLRAWSYAPLDWQCLVYPAPEPAPPPLPGAPADGPIGASQPGHDDFFALREHIPGDSLRHVAWRQAARDDILRTKQFAGGTPATHWLDYTDCPPSLDLEAKLSRLTAWVLAAEAAGDNWGLRLPGQTLQQGRGPGHRDAALVMLALFETGLTST